MLQNVILTILQIGDERRTRLERNGILIYKNHFNCSLQQKQLFCITLKLDHLLLHLILEAQWAT